MDKHPVLLIYDHLESEIDFQLSELALLETNPSKINFFYAFSLLEGTIWQCLRRIITAFPEKLKGKEKEYRLEIDYDILISNNDYYVIIDEIIFDRLEKKSKQNIVEYLQYLIKIAEIEINFNNNLLFEISRERNNIAHNNATFYHDNMLYARSSTSNKNYNIYIEEIKKTILEIKNKLKTKFENYTYSKLLTDAWKYTMPPCSSFSSIFDFSSGRAVINIENAKRTAQMISSGERNIFQIWLEAYSPELMYEVMINSGYVSPVWFNTLDNKINFLRKMFKEYPYMLNGTEINFKEKNNG